MTDLVVVVPGITGSVLRRLDGHAVWQSSLAAVVGGLATPRSTFEQLALPAGLGDEPLDEPLLVPGGLVSGWHTWPGLHTGSGYAGLLEAAGDTAVGAVRVFDYDWRLSNRHTARLLAAKVQTWLGEWRERTGDPDARVCFLCHSMGGLIARYYLEVLGGRETAGRLLTLGTPFSGAVKAVRALTGDAFAKIPFVGARITEVVRSFPSVGQLLPAYRCVATTDGPVTLAQAQVPDLPTAIVTDGLAFHAEIAAAVARNGPPAYPIHVLVGAHNETPQSIAVRDGRVDYLEEQRGANHRGDGTVATFAAVPPEWTDTGAAEVYAVRHAALGDAEAVGYAVRNKLSPVSLADTLHPEVRLGIGLPDITEANREFVVTAHCDREDVLLYAAVVEPGTEEVVAASPMRHRGAGDYAAEVRAPAGSWRVDVTAVKELPPVTVSDLVLCTG
jgi:hypothetical protein